MEAVFSVVLPKPYMRNCSIKKVPRNGTLFMYMFIVRYTSLTFFALGPFSPSTTSNVTA